MTVQTLWHTGNERRRMTENRWRMTDIEEKIAGFSIP